MLLLIISFFAIIIGILLAGLKLAQRIKDVDLKVFFWILYAVSILTFFLIALCIYIYVTFRKKSGPLGPRGFQGYPGDKGDEGRCDQNLCRARTLAVLMEKIIEDFNQKSVEQNIRKKLCGFVTFTNSDFSHNNILKKWNLMDVKIFRDIFTKQVNSEVEVNDGNLNDILKNTVTKFNVRMGPEGSKHFDADRADYGNCEEPQP
tara:strand:- start:280 stop:891 length:612 start_codon:yes stop_codon:yes gene_type:complete